jgi:hypothetical protein
MTWTVGTAYSNAYYVFTVLIETTGLGLFTSRYKVETIYLSIGAAGGPSASDLQSFTLLVRLAS